MLGIMAMSWSSLLEQKLMDRWIQNLDGKSIAELIAQNQAFVAEESKATKINNLSVGRN